MAAVTFSMDQYDAPVYHATDRRWSSSDYEVSFSPTAFTVSNNWLPGAEGSYPIDLVRSVVEDYWHFLAGQPEREWCANTAPISRSSLGLNPSRTAGQARPTTATRRVARRNHHIVRSG